MFGVRNASNDREFPVLHSDTARVSNELHALPTGVFIARESVCSMDFKRQNNVVLRIHVVEGMSKRPLTLPIRG